jgi:hypothetical protein
MFIFKQQDKMSEAPLSIRLGLTRIGKPLTLCINLEHKLKRTATDLNTKPTTEQRSKCKFKKASFVPDGCSCLNDTGNMSSSESTGGVK